MKTLKFESHLAKLVLSGEKTSTWRLFDDKDLQKGDEIELVDFGTKEIFARAKISSMRSKKLGELNDGDWDGHEKFSSEEEMYKTYRTYYGDSVGPDTMAKLIRFVII